MRRKLIFIAVAILAGCMVGLTSCGAEKQQDKTIPGGIYEEKQTTISLDQTSVRMDVYDSITLTAMVENFEGSISWLSTNPDVATVEGGVVTAIAVGETIISATANGVVASCNVSVSKSAEIPAISLSYDTIGVYEGETFVVSADTIWKGRKVTDVVYSITLAGENNIATITETTNPGEFIVYGEQEGETEYIISATAMDSTTMATLKINVVKAVYNLVFDQFTAIENGYEYTMTYNTGEEKKEKISYSVTLGGKQIDNAAVSFESENTDILAIGESGDFVAKEEGTTRVIASVAGEGIQPFSVAIKVIVKEIHNYMVTYYDEKGTLLYSETIKEGEAAPAHADSLLPKSTTDGVYSIDYTGSVWALENGALADEAMQSVVRNLKVYRKYSYEAAVSHSYTRQEGNTGSVAWSGTMSEWNKYALIQGDCLTLCFKTKTGDQTVRVDIDDGAGNFIAEYLKQNVWYTLTIEFDENGCGKSFSLVDENGNMKVLDTDAQSAVRKFTKENLVFSVRFPIDWSTMSYGDAVDIDVKAVVAGAVAEKIVQQYTIIYYDTEGNVLYTEKVEEGKSATYAANGVVEITDKEGYTHEYTNVKWMTEQGGATEADLSSISADTKVYMSGTKTTSYIKAEKYSTGAYPLFASLNKYITVSEDGSITFKIRLNGSTGAAFYLYETQGWSDNNYGVWLDSGWYTVTIDGATKHIVVRTENGEVYQEEDISWYNPETLSICLNADMDIAAIW